MTFTSALIPFCGFGGNSDTFGSKIENFSIPVCNSFVSKVIEDEICYEIDVHEKVSKITEDNLKTGLLLLIDLNEDKQFQAPLEHKNQKNKDLFGMLNSEKMGDEIKIYIETIGNSVSEHQKFPSNLF